MRDRKYGEQFRAESYLSVQPATFIGIEKYLGSGLVKGIGHGPPASAALRARHPGGPRAPAPALDRGRRHRPVRSARIRDAWLEQSKIKDVMIFLQSHAGEPLSPGAGDLRHRFSHGRQDRADLGIPADSRHRLGAGVLYALQQAADKGQVFVARRDLVDTTAELLAVDVEVVPAIFDELARRDEIAVVPLDDADAAVYLKPLEVAERGVAERVKSLTAQRDLPLKSDVGRGGALERALTAKLLVITGGPGTGKTTLVRGIVGRKGLKVELAVPTGRCSIHKSQGSEYTAVVIPLHTQHYVVLQRNLYYTAITRGRKLVVVVGSRRALELAVRTESSSRRATLLARRLREVR